MRGFLLVATFTVASAHAGAESPKPVTAANTKAGEVAPAPVTKLTFTNKLVGDKKVWEPSEAKIPAGKVEITFVNTLADPHGFNAPGVVESVVVQGNETKTITVDTSKSGAYKFSCQLHPAHVGGTITVQ